MAALVLVVVWGIAVAAIVDGPNGTAGGIAMSVVGVPVAVLALSCAGHLVRPLRVTADAAGLTVRLPLWPARTVPWEDIAAVSGSARYVVVECDEPVGRLPRTCRLRAAHRRLAPDLGLPADATGLCFETQIFDFEPVEMLAAMGQYAPEGLPLRKADGSVRQFPA